MNIDLSFLHTFTLIRMLYNAEYAPDVWELDDELMERHPWIWPRISRWFI